MNQDRRGGGTYWSVSAGSVVSNRLILRFRCSISVGEILEFEKNPTQALHYTDDENQVE